MRNLRSSIRPCLAVGAIAVALPPLSGIHAASPMSAVNLADVCGDVGGRHVEVSDCTDPVAPAGNPAPAPDVTACADVGRRVEVGGCV